MSAALARIDMMQLLNGEPGVKLTVEKAFMDLDPVDRCTLLAAAVDLCEMAISAICTDNPDRLDEIMERLAAMSIEPSLQRLN